jgi:transposase InsO family protein
LKENEAGISTPELTRKYGISQATFYNLDLYLFKNLTEVRDISSEWLYDYNADRPHEALNNMTPYEYLLKKDYDTLYL